MGWLSKIKGMLGGAPRHQRTQALSTQPMTTQALGSTMPVGGELVSAEVPAHIQIGAELGRGAMAVVHRAFDSQRGREIGVRVQPVEASQVEHRMGLIAGVRAAIFGKPSFGVL